MLKEECKKYLTDVVERLIEETPENDVEDLKDRFNKAQEIHKFENNYIYVIVKDALTKIVIEKFSSRRMNELLQEVSGTKLGFKFMPVIRIGDKYFAGFNKNEILVYINSLGGSDNGDE